MSHIRIVCLNETTYLKIQKMWSSENRLKRAMLKQFVRTRPYEESGVKGFEIGLISKLIKIEHLRRVIEENLDDEGFFKDEDYKLELITDEVSR